MKITFGKTQTDPTTGWKSAVILQDGERIGEIVKDTGTHWQINLDDDRHPKWGQCRDIDADTLADAKWEAKRIIGA